MSRDNAERETVPSCVSNRPEKPSSEPQPSLSQREQQSSSDMELARNLYREEELEFRVRRQQKPEEAYLEFSRRNGRLRPEWGIRPWAGQYFSGSRWYFPGGQ